MNPQELSPEMQELFQRMLAKAMAEQQAKSQDAMKMELGIADQLGPEGMTQQVGLGTLDQRGQLAGQKMGAQQGLMQGQLDEARAMRKGGVRDYGTAAGNIAAGLGDAVSRLGGGIREQQLLAQMQGGMDKGFGDISSIFDKQDAGRGAFSNARYNAMRGFFGGSQQQPSPAVPYYLAKP